MHWLVLAVFVILGTTVPLWSMILQKLLRPQHIWARMEIKLQIPRTTFSPHIPYWDCSFFIKKLQLSQRQHSPCKTTFPTIPSKPGIPVPVALAVCTACFLQQRRRRWCRETGKIQQHRNLNQHHYTMKLSSIIPAPELHYFTLLLVCVWGIARSFSNTLLAGLLVIASSYNVSY